MRSQLGNEGRCTVSFTPNWLCTSRPYGQITEGYKLNNIDKKTAQMKPCFSDNRIVLLKTPWKDLQVLAAGLDQPRSMTFSLYNDYG